MSDTTKDYYYSLATFNQFEQWFTKAANGQPTTVLTSDTGFKPSTLRVMARSALHYGIKELGKSELSSLSINKAKSGKECIGILIALRTRRSIMGHEVIALWRAEFQGWCKRAESETYEAHVKLDEADKLWLRDYCHAQSLYLVIYEDESGFKVVR